MPKIISVCKNGKRIDMTKEQLVEMQETLTKGGPGSGRKPESGSRYTKESDKRLGQMERYHYGQFQETGKQKHQDAVIGIRAEQQRRKKQAEPPENYDPFGGEGRHARRNITG